MGETTALIGGGGGGGRVEYSYIRVLPTNLFWVEHESGRTRAG